MQLSVVVVVFIWRPNSPAGAILVLLKDIIRLAAIGRSISRHKIEVSSSLLLELLSYAAYSDRSVCLSVVCRIVYFEVIGIVKS